MTTTKILSEGLTFDDVLLVPRYSEVLPRSVSAPLHLEVQHTIAKTAQ